LTADVRDTGLRAAAAVTTIAVNVGLFAGMILAGLYTEKKEDDPPPQIITADIIQLTQQGVPRDPKLLPRIPTVAPTPPPPEPVVKTGPPDPQAPPQKDEVKIQPEPQKPDPKQQQEDEKRKREEEERKRKQIHDRINNALARVGDEDAPPEGSLDGSPNGNTTDPTKTNAFLGYLGQLQLVLSRNFEVPATIPPEKLKQLTCDVQFQLGDDGKVKGEPVLIQSSGNNFFDEAALRTVRKFGPGTDDRLPLPTEPKLRKVVLTSPITSHMHK
jgi:TonB family protein